MWCVFIKYQHKDSCPCCCCCCVVIVLLEELVKNTAHEKFFFLEELFIVVYFAVQKHFYDVKMHYLNKMAVDIMVLGIFFVEVQCLTERGSNLCKKSTQFYRRLGICQFIRINVWINKKILINVIFYKQRYTKLDFPLQSKHKLA